MGKTSIEWLFSDKKEIHKTEEWYEHLKKNESLYSNCSVVSFTRVKNLDSKYMHEYVQFIVEENTTGDRTRVYAERGNEKDLDWVTCGRTEVDGNILDDMPLPLTSLIFNKGKRPSILDIAYIFSTITVKGGGYQFRGNNCFWFANLTYKVVRTLFVATEKQWRWVNPGGSGGGGFTDAYGLGFPTMFKFMFKPSASEFKVERHDNLNFAEPTKSRVIVAPDTLVTDVIENLLKDDALEEYIAAMQLNGINVNKSMVEEAGQKANTAAIKASKLEDIKWTEKFDDDVQDFVKKVLEDDQAEKYKEAYEKARLANSKANGKAGPDIEPEARYVGPLAEEYEQTVEALNTFAGKVIFETGLI